MKKLPIVIIGGGAAGFFAAIAAAEADPSATVMLIEKSRQLLAKVRISGGGRCNVTHACFEPSRLVQHYPRGSNALKSAFSRFQPRDTVSWFEQRGVQLKTEADGRMFPTTDSSQTIIDCLIQEAKKAGVKIETEMAVTDIQKVDDRFIVHLFNKPSIECAKLLVATGGARSSFSWLQALNHTIQPLVPSLFTFNIANFSLKELAGVSVKKVGLKIANTPLEESGPLLITHWGFSGPSVLRLSAWGARVLHDVQYKAELIINWIPDISFANAKSKLEKERTEQPRKQISNVSLFDLSNNLWKALLQRAKIAETQRLSDLSNKHILSIVECLKSDRFQIEGQTTYKEEFVTCGGVSLNEVEFKTMESKLAKGLFFAGEILDVDGITGGFNFQNAWTTGWIAGKSIVKDG